MSDQQMSNEEFNEYIKKFEVLSGRAWYAFLHAPDKGNVKFKIGPAFKIDLVLDSEDQLKKAEELGLRIKEPTAKIPGKYVSIKSKVPAKEEDKDKRKPKVFDSKRNAIPSSILVGNGSEVNVRFFVYEYGDGERTPILKEVQVTKLVEYKPTDSERERKGAYLDKVDGGFVVGDVNEAI